MTVAKKLTIEDEYLTADLRSEHGNIDGVAKGRPS